MSNFRETSSSTTKKIYPAQLNLPRTRNRIDRQPKTLPTRVPLNSSVWMWWHRWAWRIEKYMENTARIGHKRFRRLIEGYHSPLWTNGFSRLANSKEYFIRKIKYAKYENQEKSLDTHKKRSTHTRARSKPTHLYSVHTRRYSGNAGSTTLTLQFISFSFVDRIKVKYPSHPHRLLSFSFAISCRFAALWNIGSCVRVCDGHFEWWFAQNWSAAPKKNACATHKRTLLPSDRYQSNRNVQNEKRR